LPCATPEAQRAYQREWIKRRREEFLDGKVCVDCGADERLELDHIDPALKVDHKIWSWSEARREAEIAKCEIRCRPCHAKRHARLARSKWVHGSLVMYKNAACRCDECRRANREYEHMRRRAA